MNDLLSTILFTIALIIFAGYCVFSVVAGV